MMTNEFAVTAEPKPTDRRLSTSLSTDVISVAARTPLPAHTEAKSDSRNTGRRSHSRKTKIIATLGPATESGDVLRGLLESGVSVFRVTLASIGREAALKAIYTIRSISTELQRPVSLVFDTQFSPEGAADSPATTEGDWADIRFGLELGVDWIALSAAHDGDTVRQLRQFLADQKRNNVNILARIGDWSAVAAPDRIIQESDGVIFRFGNPTYQRPTAETLAAARLIVEKCVSARKLAVIAANGEADVTDALSAQPDALLIAEEFHAGSDPLQGLQTLDGLIRRAESNGPSEVQSSIALATEQDKAVAAAMQQADEMTADAIVVFTRLGNSACLCAALRPRQSPVFAFTPDARLARRLRFRYALEPVVLPFSEQPKKTLQAAEKVLLERKLLAPGAKVVFVTDILDQDERISSVQVRTLGGYDGNG
jgi:pyruvate kinase